MISINLLPWRAYRRAKKKKQMKIFAMICLSFLAPLFFYFFTEGNRHQPLVKKALLQSHVAPHDLPVTLNSVSIYQMKWAGSLKLNHLFVGLIKLPNGKTDAVNSGARVGLEKALIVAIGPATIQLKVKGLTVILKEEH